MKRTNHTKIINNLTIKPVFLKKIFSYTFILVIITSLFSQLAEARTHWCRDLGAVHSLVYEEKLRHELLFLTDSICGGRATGTRGNIEAACWIMNRFEASGLLPMGRYYTKGFRTGQGKVGHNVMAMFPGSPERARDRYIIVGAHFDHLGTISGKLYPGADSNASGVVALTTLAEMFAASRKSGALHDHNIIFVAFDAKEYSMAGSNALWKMIEDEKLRDPQNGRLILKEDISLMVNIDQVGGTSSAGESGRKDFMIMLGGETLPKEKRDLLYWCNISSGVCLELYDSYFGSKNFTDMFYRRIGDQRIFVEQNIPAVFFTSGISMRNNKPTDTVGNLNLEILRKRIILMWNWIAMML